MKRLFVLGSGIALASLASAAQAQEPSKQGFYAGANIGIAGVNDVNITYYDAGGTFGGSGSQDTAEGTFDFNSAATIGGVLGYDFGMIRSDLEINYSRNKVKSFTINSINGQRVTLSAADRQDVCDYLEADSCGGSGNTFNIDGSRMRQLSAFANLWVDLPVGSVVTPYLGGGLGMVGLEVDGEGQAKLGWQIGVGAAVNLNPATALTLDYRHREVGKIREEWDANSGYRLGKVKTDAILAGVRVTF